MRERAPSLLCDPRQSNLWTWLAKGQTRGRLRRERNNWLATYEYICMAIRQNECSDLSVPDNPAERLTTENGTAGVAFFVHKSEGGRAENECSARGTFHTVLDWVPPRERSVSVPRRASRACEIVCNCPLSAREKSVGIQEAHGDGWPSRKGRGSTNVEEFHRRKLLSA